MKVYFLRHGEAEDKKPGLEDKDRPLTSYGAAMVSNTGKGLRDEEDSFDLILTSPHLRARQSADIMGNIFNCQDRISQSESLLFGTPPSVLVDELKRLQGVERVLLVGHQPHLGECVSFLTGQGGGVSIKKSGMVLLELDGTRERGKLIWTKEPPALK